MTLPLARIRISYPSSSNRLTAYIRSSYPRLRWRPAAGPPTPSDQDVRSWLWLGRGASYPTSLLLGGVSRHRMPEATQGARTLTAPTEHGSAASPPSF